MTPEAPLQKYYVYLKMSQLLKFTFCDLSHKYDLNQRKAFSEHPAARNLQRSIQMATVSNARFKSKYIAHTIWPMSMAQCHGWVSEARAWMAGKETKLRFIQDGMFNKIIIQLPMKWYRKHYKETIEFHSLLKTYAHTHAHTRTRSTHTHNVLSHIRASRRMSHVRMREGQKFVGITI